MSVVKLGENTLSSKICELNGHILVFLNPDFLPLLTCGRLVCKRRNFQNLIVFVHLFLWLRLDLAHSNNASNCEIQQYQLVAIHVCYVGENTKLQFMVCVLSGHAESPGCIGDCRGHLITISVEFRHFFGNWLKSNSPQFINIFVVIQQLSLILMIVFCGAPSIHSGWHRFSLKNHNRWHVLAKGIEACYNSLRFVLFTVVIYML